MILKTMKNNYLILNEEFLNFCKLNNVNDINQFAEKVFQRGFTIEKYGETPKGIKITNTSNDDEISKLKNEIIELKKKLEEKNIINKTNLYSE